MSAKPPLPAPDTAPSIRTVPADAVLSLAEAQALLGLKAGTLPREARLGRLKVSRRAGRLWVTGSWLREWMEAGLVPRACQTCDQAAAGR